MDGVDTVLVSDVVIVEAADVLTSVYEVPRAAVFTHSPITQFRDESAAKSISTPAMTK